MQVSQNVRAVQVPDDSPMHPQFTNIYLVGEGQVFSIDSGEDMDSYRWMLRGYLAAVEKAEIALSGITHHHIDHSANLKWLRELYGVDIYVHAAGKELLKDKLPEDGVKTMSDQGMIDIGPGAKVMTLLTPGHSVDSVCYYLEDDGVLFSGDTILGSTPTTINDLFDYMASLERIRSLPNLEVICPGHGPLITNPHEYIDEYIRHRNQREEQIVRVLSEAAELSSWDIMERIYTDIDTRLRRAAAGNVEKHLAKLEREGRLKVYPGVPKELSEEEQAKAHAEEEEHAHIIALAEEYKAQARKRELEAQENPPSDQWVEMPKFELVR